MGKIGDLFVRLGLKSDGFKKGMQDAKKETQDFGSKLGKMKAGAVAVWAAIGTAVIKFGQDFIAATNKMGDAWASTMASLKASYHSVIADMSNYKPDFSSLKDFFKGEWKWIRKTIFNAEEAGDAAKEMTKAFDAEFELVNSVRLQRQQVQQELNELYIQMRDTTLSPEARKAAAERYKELLQPIADAEVSVYGDMLESAVKAWQAGTDLDRVYSTDEMVEFFSRIGTEYDKMAAKFPDLMRVYETRKGDAQNLLIFDTIAKWQDASNQMSNIDRELGRIMNSIKAKLQGDAPDDKISGQLPTLPTLPTISAVATTEIQAPDIFSDEWLAKQIANGQAFGDEYMAMIERTDAMNQMLEASMVSALSGGMQAFTDMMFGLEGAGAEQVLAALMTPFAQTATQLGEMLLAEGIAIEAFKTSLASLNGIAAIAAGTALIAIGAALSSGIKALAGGPAGTTSASTAAAGSSATSGIETYQQDITVHVVGEIAGDKIVLAGQKTLNKWGR